MDEMSRKTYIDQTDATAKRHLDFYNRVTQLAMEEEAKGHRNRWFKDEIVELIFKVPGNNGKDRDRDHAKSWFSKLCFTGLLAEKDVLDMEPMPGKGPKYFWRHDGQIPAGMLGHRIQIVDGILPALLDFSWAMCRAGYDASELVEALGEKALLAVIACRMGAYQQWDDPRQREAALTALLDLEGEVAKRLGKVSPEAMFGAVFPPMLPPPAQL
jgi:hypothetical protein